MLTTNETISVIPVTSVSVEGADCSYDHGVCCHQMMGRRQEHSVVRHFELLGKCVNMVLVDDKADGGLINVALASYLDHPSHAVNVTVKFSAILDRSSYEQLTINAQNRNYQRLWKRTRLRGINNEQLAAV